jgi:DNA gyrase subunit A
LNLRDCIKIYLDHNIDCLIREKKYDIAEATKRKEIVDGLLKALANIDDIITLIKKSESSSVARESLIKIYSFTENQAKAILGMRLSSLAKLEGVELNNERAELEKNLLDWNDIIQSHDRQIDTIRMRLQDLVKKYGDDRRTDLMQIDIKPEEKEIAEVTPVDVVVVATKTGLIKKVPVASYKVQRTRGKGVKTQDDAIMEAVKTNTVDYLLFFTNKGRMYRTIVDNVPDGTNVAKGTPISDLIKLSSDEKIITMTSLHRAVLPKFVIFCTKYGMIKKSLLEEYMKTKRNAGIAALKLKDGDSVAEVIFQDEEDLLLITKKGMSIRFSTKEINTVGRVAMGVRGITLSEGDEVIAALPIHKDTDTVGIFASSGLGKKVNLKEFPAQGRGGKGTIVYRITDNNGELAGAAMIDDTDNLLLSGNTSNICISAKDIPLLGKGALGNILTKNKIVSVIKL